MRLPPPSLNLSRRADEDSCPAQKEEGKFKMTAFQPERSKESLSRRLLSSEEEGKLKMTVVQPDRRKQTSLRQLITAYYIAVQLKRRDESSKGCFFSSTGTHQTWALLYVKSVPMVSMMSFPRVTFARRMHCATKSSMRCSTLYSVKHTLSIMGSSGWPQSQLKPGGGP
jgi:hypothetical protein